MLSSTAALAASQAGCGAGCAGALRRLDMREMTIQGRDGRESMKAMEQGRIVGESPREPAFNAPWPAVLLAAAFLGLYGVQVVAAAPEDILARFGFVPTDLQTGRWAPLVTDLFVHGSWTHAFLNALGALAFGVPVARLFGRGAVGVAAFFLFFLVCGVLSNLGYAAAHWGAPYVLIGASGAVSGFMGASSRLIERRGELAPFTSRTVIGMAAAWVAVNVVIGWVGLGGVSGGAPIAWEAHLAGYAAGLLLVEPVARLLRRT